MSTIPTSVTEEQFNDHIRPYLNTAKRGYECSIPLYKVFNYILYRLHTGCQWECLPIDPDANAMDAPNRGRIIIDRAKAAEVGLSFREILAQIYQRTRQPHVSLNDLAGTPESQPIIRKLLARLERLQKDTGDTLDLNAPPPAKAPKGNRNTRRTRNCRASERRAAGRRETGHDGSFSKTRA